MSTATLERPAEKPTEKKARPKVQSETLRLVTFNRGDRAQYDDLFGILTNVPKTDLPVDFAALTEMYNPKLKPILLKLEKHGFRVYYGRLDGARGNPVVWNPERLQLQDPFCEKLLPAKKRDGKHNMQKNLNGGRFLFKPANRSIVAASMHAIQTNYRGERFRAALEMNREIFDILDKRRVATFLGGDFNTRPESDLLDPFRGAGWKCSQIVGDEIDTFKGRPIDMWWWDDRDPEGSVVRFLKQYARDGDSDHKALYAEFAIRIRAAR